MSLIHKFFQHRNGNFYYVLSQSTHTETGEKLINYMSLYSTEKFTYGTVWSRTYEMWNEIVAGRPRFVEVKSPPVDLIKEFSEFRRNN